MSDIEIIEKIIERHSKDIRDLYDAQGRLTGVLKNGGGGVILSSNQAELLIRLVNRKLKQDYSICYPSP